MPVELGLRLAEVFGELLGRLGNPVAGQPAQDRQPGRVGERLDGVDVGDGAHHLLEEGDLFLLLGMPLGTLVASAALQWFSPTATLLGLSMVMPASVLYALSQKALRAAQWPRAQIESQTQTEARPQSQA